MGSGAKGGVDPLESFQHDGLRPAAGDHRMVAASGLGDGVEAGQPIAHHGAARSVAKASTIDAEVCFLLDYVRFTSDIRQGSRGSRR